MADEGFKRKLTAILSADVKGYSRLMGKDEESTVRTLTAYRKVLYSLIDQHDGKVLDSPGDNLLAEFVSVVNAVKCAVMVQNEIKTRNDELPQNRRMQFRIGINLGDVIQEEDRIYGDGVNIAARLESLSDGGGICISGTAFEHVENKLDFKFKDLGEHKVKNIAKPVHVYKVIMEAESQESVLGETIELPVEPSIAVLPFKNLSGDPEQEFLSDGFTEDLITTLAKMPRMIVIARESSFTYKGKTLKVQEIGRDLGVLYVLEGSIQKFGDQLRITAQLINAADGHHLWAEKYDREMKDIFAMRDEITLKIANALQVKLTHGEMANWGPKTDSFEAYIKAMQSWEHFNLFTRDDNILSRQRAKEALALDPNYSSGMEMLAWTLLMDGVLGTSKTPEKSIEKALELAQKVLDRGDSDAGAHFLIGYAYSRKGQFDKAISELKTARDLFPNNAEINAGLGSILNRAGKPEEAINVLKKAIRLNPIPPSWYLRTLGDAYRMIGRYEDSVSTYKDALDRWADDLFAQVGLTATYSLAGRLNEARAQTAEVLRVQPKFSTKRYAKEIPYRDKAEKDRLIAALRNSGLPD